MRPAGLLANYLNILAENSTIRSYHQNDAGELTVHIECPYCEIIEEFNGIESATTFGIIHRQSLPHLQKLAEATLGHTTRPALPQRQTNRRLLPVP